MLKRLKNVYHLLLAALATLLFRYPARNLIAIGVTGTDGKTTTVHLIYSILRKAGLPVSLISSVGAKIGGQDYNLPFHVTTPSPWQLQRFLRMAQDRGDKYLVLEVTSHGLDQNRVFGCNFRIGVITNITHEHLDYHKTYDRYLLTKAKLLERVEWAIINCEDESYVHLKSKIKNQKSKIVTYGLRSGDITPAKFPFTTPLPGEYNQANCLAAIAVGQVLKIDEQKIRQAVEEFTGVSGRFEFVETGQDFRVVVDFAHTPNGLKQVLSTIKPQVSGRLIHVFGSAGLRDRLKRPKMGQISSQYADIIILTEEDFRTEDVNAIINEIAQGIAKGPKVYKIPKRDEAINLAIKMAKKGDWVVLTGKGHEHSLAKGKKEFPWDEKEEVKKTLSLL
jgi:UDP-N-acetylmuramoyl-L-alanyl-D-glutamate--2,6-diaminopimelate ligase